MPFSLSLSLSCRKNHQRQLEALKQSVEAETKAKNEQTRQRKLMEGQVDELQSTIDSNEKVRKLHHQPWGRLCQLGTVLQLCAIDNPALQP